MAIARILWQWFAHGRAALTQPIEQAIFGSERNAGVHASRGLGIPFFFSWANEAWERRWYSANADKGLRPGAKTLIEQDYGGPSAWRDHFMYLLRFFRRDDYVKVDGKPLIVIYEATGVNTPPASPSPMPPSCPSGAAAANSNLDAARGAPQKNSLLSKLFGRRLRTGGSEGGHAHGLERPPLPNQPAYTRCNRPEVPFGCAAAEQYLAWYQHLTEFTDVDRAWSYHSTEGQRHGYSWPRSDVCEPSVTTSCELGQPCQTPCEPSCRLPCTKPGCTPCDVGCSKRKRGWGGATVLEAMLSLWDTLAKENGLPGLHVAGTVNSIDDVRDNFVASTGESRFRSLLQFQPVSLNVMEKKVESSQRLWTTKVAERCGVDAKWGKQRTAPPNCTCFLHELASDEVDDRMVRAIGEELAREARTGRQVHKNMGLLRGAAATWSSWPRGRDAKAYNAFCSADAGYPEAYGRLIARQMSRALEDAGGHKMCAATAADPKASAKSAWKHMVVVNAWNEWGEQAVLEPTVQYGDAVLEHHRRAVASVEAAVRKAKAHTVGRL